MGSSPIEYEITTITKAGLKVLVRSIRPEDGPPLQELFHTLSPRSIYLRFFSHRKRLSSGMLAQLTQVGVSCD